MGWDEALWTVNRVGNQLKEYLKGVSQSTTKVPLDVLAFAADYKMHGEKSYVHNNKNYLHALYNCPEVSMNDEKLNGETLKFFIKENKVGYAFAAVYGIEHREVFEKLSTLEAVIGNETAMRAVAGNETAMRVLAGNSSVMNKIISNPRTMQTLVNNYEAMKVIAEDTSLINTIITNATLLSAICKSTYSKTKEFIKAVNSNDEYVKIIYDTVTKSSRFRFWKSYAEYLTYNGSHAISNKADTIILCRLGYNQQGGKSRALINGEIIKETNSGGQYPNNVTRETVNTVCVPTATYENIGRGQVAISVYDAI